MSKFLPGNSNLECRTKPLVAKRHPKKLVHNLMSNHPKNVIRIASVTLLVASVLMVLAGLTVLRQFLAGWWFVIYWTVCFFLTLTAAFLALLELWAIHIAARRALRELLSEHLSDIDTRLENHIPDQPAALKHGNNNNKHQRGYKH